MKTDLQEKLEFELAKAKRLLVNEDYEMKRLMELSNRKSANQGKISRRIRASVLRRKTLETRIGSLERQING